MSNSIIAQATDAPADLIAKWATPIVSIPAYKTNTGLTHGREKTLIPGDRFAVIVQQEPHNPIIDDHLYATHLACMENFAPEERVAGFHWGPNDEDNADEFVFTIVGIYTLTGETANGTGWTDVHFQLDAEAVAV